MTALVNAILWWVLAHLLRPSDQQLFAIEILQHLGLHSLQSRRCRNKMKRWFTYIDGVPWLHLKLTHKPTQVNANEASTFAAKQVRILLLARVVLHPVFQATGPGHVLRQGMDCPVTVSLTR